MSDSLAPSPVEDAPFWLPLDKVRATGLICTMIVAAVVLLPRVVWAPMFGDPGEVQLTAAVGGVGHPPGQAGIITLFRAFCLIVPAERYLTVSAVSALFALGAVAVLTLVQLRTGVHPVVAGICSLLYLADDQFWHAAITPETYATCFMLLSGTIWAFLSWLHAPRTWKLWLAVCLFAYLTVNRGPTASYALPFVGVILYHREARRAWAKNTVRKLLLVVAIGVVALVVMLGSLWVRDVPGCGYNYLDQAAPSQPHYPTENVTASDKFERLWWLATARQYDYMFHPTTRTIRGQALWLVTEFGVQYWRLMLTQAAVMLIGAIHLWRCNRTVGLFVVLMLPAGVVPILLIRVVSHTTLLPNLLFALMWLFGVGLTRVLSWHRSPAWKAVVVANIGLAVWWTAETGFLQSEMEFDGRPHVAAIDLDSLPPNALLIDFDVLPLVYMQQVKGVRPDVTIVVPHGRLNRVYLETIETRIFTTERTLPPDLGADLIGDGPVREIRFRDRDS